MESIVSSVEAILSRQRDLSNPVKDNIRSRIASTSQSASLPNNNLINDERQALKRLKTDKDIVILPADKGRVTVAMDRTDHHDKMNELVNDKQTYEELKRDPTPALQRKLNSKLLSVQQQTLQTVTGNSYGLASFHCCCRNCCAKHRGTSPFDLH